MIIKVKVRPNSKQESVNKLSDTEYEISLKEKAEDGKANQRLINILSKELNVHYSLIKIKNPKSRNKIIEVKK